MINDNLGKVGAKEREAQNEVVAFFQKELGYEYLGYRQGRKNNRAVEEDLLRRFLILKQAYDDVLIDRALYILNKTAADQNKSLTDLNKAVYQLLRYGVDVKAEAGENTQTIHLIDWEHPLNNEFALAEEVSITENTTSRPDIILYINGLAVAVLELKRSTVSVNQAIRQNIGNQEAAYIKNFFSTVQLIMAGNTTQGIRYGTIQTPEKYFLTWQEEGETAPPHPNRLHRHLGYLCNKTRLLDLIHNFIIFDSNTKKICRPNQYFGVKAAQDYVRQRQGGIIWHTQGSGKSLTMVWLSKWIFENINDARVLIITDRQELDEQIEGVYKGVNETIYRTKSGADLLDCLNNTTKPLLCSLIHKFAPPKSDSSSNNSLETDNDYQHYIADLKQNLPPNFKPKGNLHIFVDECHRTQSGKLHQAMKQILPNALFIGFTGTPLLKKDKQKSIEIFGPYIHTYKFNQAVKDGVVVDLCYEARQIEQYLTTPHEIDKWFAEKTKGLAPLAKRQLKQRWGTLKKVFSSKSRLEKIVTDIILDMGTKPALMTGEGNAMLVAGSIYQAFSYYQLFQEKGFTQCASITSYKPNASDIKKEYTGEESYTEKLKQYTIYQQMLNGKTPDVFEKEAKEKFINHPAEMKLLIVVDKLLTGFNAPPATYLYLDKSMQDHGLFQAICRVNRLDGDHKKYGYIIDYKDLFKSLEQSIEDYTSAAFDNYDPEDVADLLSNRLTKDKQRLDNALESVKALCEAVAPPYNTQSYIRYFCGNPDKATDLQQTEDRRLDLYKYTATLIRAYSNLANELPQAGYTRAEITQLIKEVEHYTAVRKEIRYASGDNEDLKRFEADMRHLIDTYIGAKDSKKVSAFDDKPLVELLIEQGPTAIDSLPSGIRQNKQAVAESIENNLRRIIIQQQSSNPKYYQHMSTLLNQLIQERTQAQLDYKSYLNKIITLSKQVKNPASSTQYPTTLNTAAKRALYDNLDQNETIALTLDAEIRQVKKDNWRGHKLKEREIKYTIQKHLPNTYNVETVFKIIKEQDEY